jgi:hypothetical protein
MEIWSSPSIGHVKIYTVYSTEFYLTVDRLIEEFHAHWMELVKTGIVKNVFDFERVYGEFKKLRGML